MRSDAGPMVASPCAVRDGRAALPSVSSSPGAAAPRSSLPVCLLLLHFTLRGQGSVCLVTNEFLVPMQDVAFGRCSVNI